MCAPDDTLTSWALVRARPGGRRLRKAGRAQYTGLAFPAPFDPQRASAADGILHQLENHGVPDREIVERYTVFEVAPMEVDLAAVRETDEPVALSDQQPHDAARGHGAAWLR